MWAGNSREGNQRFAKILLDKGADVNARTNNGKTALMEAVEKNRPEIAKLLLECGAYVDAKTPTGWTALMSAAKSADPEIPLLQKEDNAEIPADVNWAILMLDAETGINVIKVLLDNGADVNAMTNDGLTALKIAQQNNQKLIEKYLRYRGAKD